MKIGTGSEIFEQRRAEESKKELSQVRTRLETAIKRVTAVFDSRSRVGRVTVDTTGVVMEANLEAAEFTGTNQSELIGKELAARVAQADRQMFRKRILEIRSGRTRTSAFEPFEFEIVAPSGATRQLRAVGMEKTPAEAGDEQVSLSFVDVSESRALGVELGVIRDKIEHQVIVDGRLEKYQQKLRSMASQLSLTEERERRRISTNLHDRISQNLVFANMQLGVLGNSELDPGAADLVKKIRSTITAAIHNTRDIMSELSPPILHEQPLETALEWLAEHAKRAYGLPVAFEAPRGADEGADLQVPEEVQVVIFRGVQELLLNCYRYAAAGEVRVELRRTNDELCIEVEDNGAGFPRGGAEDRSGFGLFLLGERMKSLGGSLDIRSRPGAGTCVTMRLPDPARRSAADDPEDSRESGLPEIESAARAPWRHQ